MKTQRNCWYFSYSYNSAATGVEESGELRRAKMSRRHAASPRKACPGSVGRGSVALPSPLLLLVHLRSLSWHKAVTRCSPKDFLPLASFGPWTLPGSGPCSPERSVEIWLDLVNGIKLICTHCIARHAEMFAFLSHLANTQYLTLFSLETREATMWFPLYSWICFSSSWGRALLGFVASSRVVEAAPAAG